MRAKSATISWSRRSWYLPSAPELHQILTSPKFCLHLHSPPLSMRAYPRCSSRRPSGTLNNPESRFLVIFLFLCGTSHAKLFLWWAHSRHLWFQNLGGCSIFEMFLMDKKLLWKGKPLNWHNRKCFGRLSIVTPRCVNFSLCQPNLYRNFQVGRSISLREARTETNQNDYFASWNARVNLNGGCFGVKEQDFSNLETVSKSIFRVICFVPKNLWRWLQRLVRVSFWNFVRIFKLGVQFLCEKRGPRQIKTNTSQAEMLRRERAGFFDWKQFRNRFLE